MKFKRTIAHPREQDCPPWAGRLDDCSRDVQVLFKTVGGGLHWGTGYTDWNGDEFFWRVYGFPDAEVIAWSELPDLKDLTF